MINNILHNALLASNKKNKFDSTNPLTFTAEEDNSTVKLTATGEPNIDGLQFRTNINSEWSTYNIDTEIELTNIGDYVQFRNTNDSLSTSTFDYVRFKMGGTIAASGNIQSMLNYSKSCTPHCYKNMFYNCRSLTTAPELPATSLADFCYQYMFRQCTGLSSAPKLPATTLAGSCYSDMFYGCTSLSSAPELPATTLAVSCYYSMFSRCTSLEFDFELFLQSHKNSTLAKYCFAGMVAGCTNVNKNRTLIPIYEWREKYNTNYAYGCYDGLYSGCTSITKIPENYLTNICNSTTDCSKIGFQRWFSRLY